ncbi:aminotransferase class IV [Labrys monachus]|uniref:Probable branched-chain-amino-acid aminotransferase n=1 Tax=Labrys monachus TaxID=217067 RepID=A0ABU0FHJ2_9HYPH|nr:aminotransferase class IV [Labrys monachus]MDQ0394060.1 branched-chain amino acid aminotransferase [Labrys monachus]
MSFLIHRTITAGAPGTPHVSALDRGFQLGDGVFDTMVGFGGHGFLIDRHLDRLLSHAAAIGIEIDRGTVEGAVRSVLAEAGARHAIVRTTLTRGEAARGLWPAAAGLPSLVVTAQPWSASLVGQPARLAVSDIPRNQRSPLARIKSLGYLDNILAARQAAQAGADDALILNLDGNAVSTTIANIFAFDGETLVTPPLVDGCLDGVMRGLVLEEARAMGLDCREASLTSTLVARASAMFLTNSVRLVRPVSALEGRCWAGRALASTALADRMLSGILARIEHAAAIRLDIPPRPSP